MCVVCVTQNKTTTHIKNAGAEIRVRSYVVPFTIGPHSHACRETVQPSRPDRPVPALHIVRTTDLLFYYPDMKS
jgi:hypothetical protein